jgi:hypothetical protein
VAEVGETLTVIGGISVIDAEAEADVFAWLVAVTVTVCCDAIDAGAVYKPDALIVPTEGLNVQVTAWFEVFATVAVNVCVPFA